LHGFPQYIQENSRLLSKSKPRILRFTAFQIRDSLTLVCVIRGS